jgi:hypothetical protein
LRVQNLPKVKKDIMSNETKDFNQQVNFSRLNVIEIENKSNTDVIDFDFLSPTEYIVSPNMKDGNLTHKAITIKSFKSLRSYQQFLYEVMTSPLHVQIVFIEYVNGDENQIFTPFEILEKVVTGAERISKIEPFFGAVCSSVAIPHEFVIDGLTKITITKISANTKIRFYFYEKLFDKIKDFKPNGYKRKVKKQKKATIIKR